MSPFPVIQDFEMSFYPYHIAVKSELDEAMEEATGMDSAQVASIQLRAGGMKTAGAFYFREDMRMLVTINSLPKSMGWAMGNMTSITNLEALENQDDPTRVLEWYGQLLPVQRDDKTGYGQVSVMAGEKYLVQIRGNVPTAIMKEFLQSIPLIVPVEQQQAEAAEP